MAPLALIPNSSTLTILHDPASPASEYALQAMHLGCLRFDVRRVGACGTSLSRAELRDLTSRLTGDPVDALVARGSRYEALDLDLKGATAEQVVDTLAEHPELLRSPILDDGTATMIGTTTDRIDAWAVTGHVTEARPTMTLRAVRLPKAA